MGRKNKNVMGGAMSGAAAGAQTGNPYAIAGGAILGGILGSQQDDSVAQLPPVVPQDVVNKLYQQSIGNTPTIGELKGAQMYDKTLAQQIAAAKASRGVNPGLLSRNVNRIAAEQSQANAQNAAILAAEERNQALAKYMQAQQMNAGIAAQNLGFERAADQQANNMLGAGFNSLGSSFALQAQKQDAQNQMAAQQQKMATDSNSVKEPMNTSGLSLTDSGNKAAQINNSYSLGADTDLTSYSDEKMKKNKQSYSMKMMSDERQKDLIKSENLPASNNLQMQNQAAQQPQGMQAPQTAQPAQATSQASAPQAPAPAPTSNPPPGITAEMLQQAQRSSKGGGNVSNIKNSVNTLERGAAGPSQAEILDMSMRAQRGQTRDIFGNVKRSDRENYAQYMAEWQAAQDAKNAAYDAQQSVVAEENLAKDAQRTARLNRFYTGIDTGSAGAIASQYAPKQELAASDWGAAQAYQRSQGIGDQSRGTMDFVRDTINNNLQYSVPANSMYSRARSISDENQKEDIKSEKAAQSNAFNPKSFLDKLEANSYEYKKSAKGLEGAGEGRQLSVMAQDLEKAGPVGKNMVEEDEQGNKIVDYGKGFGAILASQAHLNERLSQIEKMYSKKKKES
jgi:hypothetical protein